MINQDDDKILSLLKQNSLDAYELLFKKFYKMLCMQASLLLNDEAAAEDLVETLFVEFWNKKLYLQIDQSLKGYLCLAVKNRCLNEIAKQKRLSKKQQEYNYLQETKEEIVFNQPTLSDGLQTLVAQFPVQRQRALTLVYFENKKYTEAAAEMGISINSLKTHLKLAMQILRTKIKNGL